jgi:putative salt-induced outer membrane protein YdiY
VSTVHVDGQLTLRRPADRYTFEGLINRATDRGTETAENASGSATYDRFLTKRVYFNANAIFANDKFRDLRLRTALGAGIGYQIWQSPRGQFSVDGGLGWVNQDFTVAEDTSYTALREASKLDVVIVPTLVDLFHHHDLYFGITGDDQLFYRMQNGVHFAVAKRIVATAQFNLDYDRSPSPGRKNTDRSTAITLGYKF